MNKVKWGMLCELAQHGDNEHEKKESRDWLATECDGYIKAKVSDAYELPLQELAAFLRDPSLVPDDFTIADVLQRTKDLIEKSRQDLLAAGWVPGPNNWAPLNLVRERESIYLIEAAGMAVCKPK